MVPAPNEPEDVMDDDNLYAPDYSIPGMKLFMREKTEPVPGDPSKFRFRKEYLDSLRAIHTEGTELATLRAKLERVEALVEEWTQMRSGRRWEGVNADICAAEHIDELRDALEGE